MAQSNKSQNRAIGNLVTMQEKNSQTSVRDLIPGLSYSLHSNAGLANFIVCRLNGGLVAQRSECQLWLVTFEREERGLKWH